MPLSPFLAQRARVSLRARTGGQAGTAAGRAFLQELKGDPGSFQLDTLLAEIVKLERVKAIGLPVAIRPELNTQASWPKVGRRWSGGVALASR